MLWQLKEEEDIEIQKNAEEDSTSLLSTLATVTCRDNNNL
jgi:hypothetical protein